MVLVTRREGGMLFTHSLHTAYTARQQIRRNYTHAWQLHVAGFLGYKNALCDIHVYFVVSSSRLILGSIRYFSPAVSMGK